MTTTILSILLGIGLASASGFRVFLPMFALSLSSYFDILPLNDHWQWLAGIPALITLGVATFIEIGAYYIPFIDNLLDTVATPLATIAGSVIMASTLIDLSPLTTWMLAIIAGGGTAAAIQGLTTATRLASSVKTAGFGNSALTTAETGTATALSGLAIFFPIIAFIIVVILLVIIFFIFKKIKKKFTIP